MSFGKLLVLLFAVTTSSGLLAQKRALLDTLLKKYPNSSIAGINLEKQIEISLENGVPKVSEKVKETTILLKDDAIAFESLSLYSNSFVTLKNIDARTLYLKGDSYKELKNDRIEVKRQNSSSSFYDDQNTHIVHFDQLSKGAIRTISYERTYLEPRFFGDDYLSNYYPAEKQLITLKCAKSINLAIRFFNVPDPEKYLTVSEDSKYRYYRIETGNMKKYERFGGSPDISWYMPHVVYYIRSYNDGKETKDYMNNVLSLSAWYSSLLKNIPPITDKRLIQVTDSLVTNSATEDETVKKVFNWVQKNIKYIAFEDGMGGFVPRDPSVVFQKRYGDCKDMAFLIYSMLRLKGINAYLTWIGTRSKPYTFSQVPTPLTDDHMIACYQKPDGTYIYLDATDKQVLYGSPSSFIQGKQALIGTQQQFKDTAYVPVIPYHRNVTTDSSYFRIEKSAISGRCVNYFTGYSRINFINDMLDLSKQKKEEYIIGEYEKGNNKFFISNQKEELEYNDTTSRLSFDFSVKDYVKSADKELFVNMNLEQNTGLFKFEDTYTTPYRIKEKHLLNYVKVLEIPPGYEVSVLPANFSQQTNDCELAITYEHKSDKIICKVTIAFKSLLISHADLEEWNKLVKSYTSQKKQIVVLKQTS